MGSFPSKKRSKLSHPCAEKKNNVSKLTQKVRILREEMKEMMQERRAYQREMMVYALKEAEWKQERNSLRDEVKRLRKSLEEKEGKIKEMEEVGGKIDNYDIYKGSSEKEWEELLLGRDERDARRDETVEKWKQLYLTIKTELDYLILRTTLPNPAPGEDQYTRSDGEEMIEELRKELKDKEDNIEALKAKLESMEVAEFRKQRDIDILRQSLRIMSFKNYKRKSRTPRNFLGNFAFLKHTIKKHNTKCKKQNVMLNSL